MLPLHVTKVEGWHQRGEAFPGDYLISADGKHWTVARWPLPSGPQYQEYRGVYLGDQLVAYVQDQRASEASA